MISRVLAIAGNTIREAIRSRILYTLLAFAVVMIAAGVVLANLSYVERERILVNLGLAMMRLFGTIIAIAVGINLIYREVERRTVYTILSKPVSRPEFLVGKYLGLVATLWMQLGIMAAAFAGTAWVGEASLDGAHATAVALMGVEMAVVVGVATLFSSFTTPMLAALFTAGITVAGHLTRDLVALGAQSGERSIEAAARLIHRVLPDLSSFNLTVEAAHGLPIDRSDVTFALLYGAAYVAVLLVLSSVVFERRDFK